jgi:hypothetical protein
MDEKWYIDLSLSAWQLSAPAAVSALPLEHRYESSNGFKGYQQWCHFSEGALAISHTNSRKCKAFDP